MTRPGGAVPDALKSVAIARPAKRPAIPSAICPTKQEEEHDDEEEEEEEEKKNKKNIERQSWGFVLVDGGGDTRSSVVVSSV